MLDRRNSPLQSYLTGLKTKVNHLIPQNWSPQYIRVPVDVYQKKNVFENQKKMFMLSEWTSSGLELKKY